MPNELNHIIVHVKDRRAAANFVADLMDTAPPVDWGPFTQITSSNGVGIDFADDHVAPDNINGSHLAYLVTDEEFDAIFGRIEQRGVRYWADPSLNREGEINHNYGGRGVYVLDPGGTCAVEFITTPYGESPGEVKTPTWL
ncbi:VOC family protein [Streptomyces sp. UNOC14_S4]|uniref:VOC family protein n=1 Tax=Streptomyces sp. UNOC14_S4 TaxID=2872340 RepID=UPI001E2AF32C|nr:VOC family protein [Streptomyces sp. UNOC14_S4]MCC3770847.1 VOC family protein [Streptomyces sp. UNOC14_S4]